MSSAEEKQVTQSAVLESRRRVVGLSRHLHRRNSFKSPVLKAGTCNTTSSRPSKRAGHEVNITKLARPDSATPQANATHSTRTANVRPASSGTPGPVAEPDQVGLKLEGAETDSVAAKPCTASDGTKLPQISTPSSSRKRPQTQRNIFGKKFKKDFKSPVRNVTGEESLPQIKESIADLKDRLQTVDDQIKDLQESGHKLEEVQRFMVKLHEYNELKDIGQFLIGQIACKEGTTTKQVYGRFGLNLED